MLLGCMDKLKKLEQEINPKVERLMQDLQILLQPKRKEAKQRWKVEYFAKGYVNNRYM